MLRAICTPNLRIDPSDPPVRKPWHQYGRVMEPDQPTRYMVRTIDARWRRVFAAARRPGVLFIHENNRRMRVEIIGGLDYVLGNVKRFD